MKRRDFLRKGFGASVLAGSMLKLGGVGNFASASQSDPAKPYDLVAVMGGEPAPMFDKAIAALGGMAKYVKRGQSVVVKPNIGWDTIPELGANTNPHLVGRIVEHCLKAGASNVSVFDHTCDTWNLCYTNSGIEEAVRNAGGRMVPGNTENYYKTVQINGKSLKEAKVHELILNSDVFINVPVLKHHSSTRVTIAMKNLMGIVWDRRWWHRNDLNQCIADFAAWERKPDLNVIDAYRVMTQNGPRGVSRADLVMRNSLIVSEDMVAADAASTRIFGSEPSDVPHIKIAHEMGIGNMNLDELNIERIRV